MRLVAGPHLPRSPTSVFAGTCQSQLTWVRLVLYCSRWYNPARLTRSFKKHTTQRIAIVPFRFVLTQLCWAALSGDDWDGLPSLSICLSLSLYRFTYVRLSFCGLLSVSCAIFYSLRLTKTQCIGAHRHTDNANANKICTSLKRATS